MIDPNKPFKFTKSEGFFDPEMIKVKIKITKIKHYADRIWKYIKKSSR